MILSREATAILIVDFLAKIYICYLLILRTSTQSLGQFVLIYTIFILKKCLEFWGTVSTWGFGTQSPVPPIILSPQLSIGYEAHLPWYFNLSTTATGLPGSYTVGISFLLRTTKFPPWPPPPGPPPSLKQKLQQSSKPAAQTNPPHNTKILRQSHHCHHQQHHCLLLQPLNRT